jgi:hypothetical protein
LLFQPSKRFAGHPGNVINGNDVRMIERRGGLGLFDKPTPIYQIDCLTFSDM